MEMLTKERHDEAAAGGKPSRCRALLASGFEIRKAHTREDGARLQALVISRVDRLRAGVCPAAKCLLTSLSKMKSP
jgi:hypothetical protein